MGRELVGEVMTGKGERHGLMLAKWSLYWFIHSFVLVAFNPQGMKQLEVS